MFYSDSTSKSIFGYFIMHPAFWSSSTGISRISNFPDLLNFPRWLADNEIEDAKSTQPASDTI